MPFYTEPQIKKILLVEDDPRDAELTLSALASHNLADRVVVTDNGADALDYLYQREKYQDREGGDPVVVLLDLKLPKVNGLEVLKAIKGDPHLRTIPVVVLTSSRETQDLGECYKLAVNAYVVKPLAFEDFMNAVKQLGIFWACINEAPPVVPRSESRDRNGKISPAAKKDAKHEDPTAHPAFGG
jgi:CheY-like chemotaxis protein